MSGYTVEEMAEYVADLLRSFAPARCVLVGHSMMGKVSMVVASRSPENLVGLVLTAPSPLEAEPIMEDAREAMVHGNRDERAARRFFLNGVKRTLGPADIVQGTEDAMLANPIAWRRWPQSGTREDWSAAIPSIDTPALLLVGEHDPTISLRFQREKTLAHLRHGTLEIIPDVGHLLPYEAPQEVAKHVRIFVGGLSL